MPVAIQRKLVYILQKSYTPPPFPGNNILFLTKPSFLAHMLSNNKTCVNINNDVIFMLQD